MQINSTKMIIAAATLALAAVPAMAHGRTASGFGEGRVTPGEESCWSEFFGGATNSCSGSRRLVLPILNDSTNKNVAVTVNAYGASSTNNVGCYTQGRSKDAATFWSSPTKYLASFGSGQDIVLAGTWVPTDGMMDTYCFVNQGGRVNSFRY